MRRVVITGMGTVCPLGTQLPMIWQRLLNGDCGVAQVHQADIQDIACRVAAEVPIGLMADNAFDPNEHFSTREQKRIARFIKLGIVAAETALKDAGWHPTEEEDCDRTGVMLGSGMGGVNRIADNVEILLKQGPRKLSPFFIPSALVNLLSGQVSMRNNLRGPNHACATACATGTHAIGDAARIVAYGDADVMVAGGAESCINRIGLAGFAAAKTLSTAYNDSPELASRPWDKDRDGFVMGEGAGALIVEEYEHARKRGARIYAEIIGYGMSGDAHHVTAPPEDGNGAFRAMRAALRDASISTDQIDYINAHGTSTPLGDDIEVGVIERLLGADAAGAKVSSTKGAIGHLLGAAGAVEAIFTALAIHHRAAPPTRNLYAPSRLSDIDRIPHTGVDGDINVSVSNSFGFGGTNACLVMRRV